MHLEAANEYGEIKRERDKEIMGLKGQQVYSTTGLQAGRQEGRPLHHCV
jgi:hypothetical protein